MKQYLGLGAAMLAGAVMGAAAVNGLHAQAKAPIYLVTEIDVTNPEAYARYAAAATKAIADHGGKALARGGRSEALEGKARARNVVLEFESHEAARRYFYAEQYQAARKLREGAAEIEMVLVEGN